MSEDDRDHIRRVNEIYSQTLAYAGFAEDSTVGLRHLATALLSDPAVRSALAPLQIPLTDELFMALTNAEPFEERFAKRGIRQGPRLVTLPPTSCSVGPELFNCLRTVLSGNTLEGLPAHLALLRRVLTDDAVKSALLPVIDVSALETSLEQAMKREGLT